MVCEAIDQYCNSTKIPEDLKQEPQNISCAVQPIIEEEHSDEIVSTLHALPFFEQVTAEKMAEEQQKDPTLKLICQSVTDGNKAKNIAYSQNKIKSCEKIIAPVQ